MILFINIIAEGGGVVVKERTELVLQLNYNHVYKKSLLRSKIKKRGLLGPRFLIKKRTEQPQLSFTSRTYTHTHTLYVHNG